MTGVSLFNHKDIQELKILTETPKMVAYNVRLVHSFLLIFPRQNVISLKTTRFSEMPTTDQTRLFDEALTQRWVHVRGWHHSHNHSTL